METQKGKFGNWLKNSITAKMLVIGILALVLLIPLSFVKEIIYERSIRQTQVISEINQKWGNEVLLSGPILKIPYHYYTEKTEYDQKRKEDITKREVHLSYLYYFPDELNIDAKVETKPLERSIYKSVVYHSQLQLKGYFPKISMEEFEIPDENILWDKATILVKTSNLKGIKSELEIQLGSLSSQLMPIYNQESLKTLQSDPISKFNEVKDAKIPFEFSMNINGSESLKFIPIGKTTNAKMTSNWASPSFDGNFLPEDGSRNISSDGFEAEWKILQINRQFEQSFRDNLPNLSQFAFGTNLIITIDDYQKNERTAKYGFMVISLTLMVFFLIQIVSKIYIHPFQYLMIGLALVMFYCLLISISEHATYFKAYLIAGSSVLILITIYSKFIFKNIKFPLLIVFSLAAVYSFIYVIIQLENYALLIGSIGLFMILAIIMFASRKIDWSSAS
ncbi:cell envelope integrity protein CreD [Mesonia aestuariivivens]|uniref:Cell envelope integrity protein CreD n=1 Tax=Mesonia aestuariivivens TaxID=2796128 RepID=A0ABS6VZ67_9FLAO|nr:cell envelope integrity protein CreD [Mesonia aestuariivivens]MBW2960875.1 cell envelope integrity protein CreD [Mesonia aestuariivivens]